MEAPRLLGAAYPGRRGRTALHPGREKTEPDAGFWVLAGTVVGGVGAAWAFWHPSASQGYFFAGVIPLGAVLTVCALAGRGDSLRPAMAAAVAGAAWVFIVPETDRPAGHSISAWAWAMARAVLLTAALTAVVVAVVVAIGKGRAARALPATLIAALVGASIATGVGSTADVLTAPRPPVNKTAAVSSAEMRAALWLDAHARQNDLVATNVHCMSFDPKRVCDARAFWVTGLGGRRALIESWGYSDAAVAANGVDGLRYSQQPAPDPEVYDLNQRAIAGGDPKDVQ